MATAAVEEEGEEGRRAIEQAGTRRRDARWPAHGTWTVRAHPQGG